MEMRGYIMMRAHNLLCGDKVHIYLKLDKEKNISCLVLKVSDVQFL